MSEMMFCSATVIHSIKFKNASGFDFKNVNHSGSSIIAAVLFQVALLHHRFALQVLQVVERHHRGALEALVAPAVLAVQGALGRFVAQCALSSLEDRVQSRRYAKHGRGLRRSSRQFDALPSPRVEASSG